MAEVQSYLDSTLARSDYHLSGWVYVHAELSRAAGYEPRLFVPAQALLLIVVSFAIFRRFSIVAVLLLNLAMCTAVTCGFMALCRIVKKPKRYWSEVNSYLVFLAVSLDL